MIILRTLGTASIEIERSTVITPNAPRRFAVLLYLAAEHDREISRERLTSLVFPDQTSSEAAHSLREVMYQLRRVGAPIVGGPRGFMMSAEDVRSDYDDALRAPVVDDDIMRAMGGGFLPAFAPQDAESYSEWLDGFRAEQIAALSRRMLAHLDDAMRSGRWETAERAARACIGLDPWNERATFALVEILAIGGSKAAALQLLDRYMAEVGPQSADLAARAGVLRRRIGEGLSTTLLGAASRNGVESFGMSAPRLVGRETEMAGLLEAFEHVRSGEPQCVVVAGEPGIGKTRLVADFSALAVLRAAHVQRVTIQPHDGDRPMGAFVDLVPALLDANGALGCSPDSMAALRNLIGKRSAHDAPQQVTGAEEHEQRWSAVSRSVVDLCEAIASEQTLVVVVEDAHWLDALSANTIGRIVGTKRKARILVIATTRDPRPLVREIRLTERCQTITLPPLVPAAANELLDIVLPTPDKVVREERAGETGSSIKSRIATISAGNPLFLISLAAHSRAHRGPFEVPGTIIETFAQRIDGLSRRAMSVLATCAELGKHSTIKRLIRALEMRKHDMVESLLELTHSGLVLRDGQNAVPAHPLVAEALRSRLAEPARRAVAHSVAATLEEEAERGQSPAMWWDVAESWRVADAPERIIYALRQCARHALEFGRPGEAARLLEQAARVPQAREHLHELSISLIRAADAASEFSLVLRGAELLRSTKSQSIHDECEMAELHAHFAVHRSDAWLPQRLSSCVFASDATPTHRVEAAIILLKCADAAGRADLRSTAHSKISADDLALVDVFLRLEFEILAASTKGDRQAAASKGRELICRFRELEERPSTPIRYYLSAIVALELGGCFDEAIAELKRLYDLAERRTSYRCRQFAAVRLLSLLWESGDESEAEVWLGRALSIGIEMPELANDFDFATSRLEIAIFHGQFDQAMSVLDEQSETTVRCDEIGRRWIDAAALAVKSGRGHLGEESHTAVLHVGLNRLKSMTGVRDFEVAVCVEALLGLGRREDAINALAQYLENERSDVREPTRLLKRAIRSVGALAEVGTQIISPPQT